MPILNYYSPKTVAYEKKIENSKYSKNNYNSKKNKEK